LIAAAVLVSFSIVAASAQQPSRGGALATVLERMDEPTRQALFYARLAVSQHGGEAIGVEHILVGLLRAAPITVKGYLSADALEKLEQSAAALLPEGATVAEKVEIPFNHEAVRVLRNIARDSTGVVEIKPEHLLLSLLSDQQSPVGKLLHEVGISREAVLAYLQRSP